MAPRRYVNRNVIVRRRSSKRAARYKSKTVKNRRAPSTIGSHIASGVRTLTSFLPGQTVVRPAVDFILKAIGIASAISSHNNNIIANLQVIGLTTRKILYYGDLLANCKNIGLQDLDNAGNPTLRLNFLTGRILSLTIRAEPTAKTSERSGEWAMCLVPLKDAAVKQRYSALFPQFEEIKNMPFSRSGLATKPLVLTWTPQFPRDGIASMERDLQSRDPVGYMYLAYNRVALISNPKRGFIASD